MFNVLRSLRDISTSRPDMTWDIVEDQPGQGMALVARIPVSDEDVELVRDMQALFAPAEQSDESV